VVPPEGPAPPGWRTKPAAVLSAGLVPRSHAGECPRWRTRTVVGDHESTPAIPQPRSVPRRSGRSPSAACFTLASSRGTPPGVVSTTSPLALVFDRDGGLARPSGKGGRLLSAADRRAGGRTPSLSGFRLLTPRSSTTSLPTEGGNGAGRIRGPGRGISQDDRGRGTPTEPREPAQPPTERPCPLAPGEPREEHAGPARGRRANRARREAMGDGRSTPWSVDGCWAGWVTFPEAVPRSGRRSPAHLQTGPPARFGDGGSGKAFPSRGDSPAPRAGVRRRPAQRLAARTDGSKGEAGTRGERK